MSLKNAKINFLVDMATDLFMARSINEVTIRDIAVAAQVGEATIYRTFGSKQNIVVQAAMKLQAIVSNEFFKLEKGKTGYEKLALFYQSYYEIFLKYPNFYKFLNEFDAFVSLVQNETPTPYESAIEVYEEPKNSLDVVITGNSDVYRGISPMEMYNKHGIASYSFVSAGQRAWTAYAMLEEVYRLQSPQIVLFNVDELYSDNQSSANNYIKVYNNMELAGPKLRGIFNKDYKKGIAVKITHFLPIFAFHDRYKELSKDDLKYAFDAFVDYKNPTKGMDVVAVSNPYTGGNYMTETDEVEEILPATIKYLDKMVDLSKDNNTEFVLFEIPSPDSWNYAKHNALQKYANEHGLKFIDLNLIDIGIDWNTDTVDGGDHLNIYGAKKVSNYMADFLHENYDLSDIREDEKYSIWKTQYEEYLKIIEYEEEFAKNRKTK